MSRLRHDASHASLRKIKIATSALLFGVGFDFVRKNSHFFLQAITYLHVSTD